MTIKSHEEIKCPQCGVMNQTLIWDTLNVTLEPAGKQALLDGKINFYHCASCGLEVPIIKDFLYHDMDKEFFVQYYPSVKIEDDDFLSQFTGDGKVKMDPRLEVGAPEYLKNIHVVFDMGELVRWVIFRDRLAEIGKIKR